MDEKRVKRENESIEKEAESLVSNTGVESTKTDETTELSPIESVRQDISSNRHSIDIYNQMVSEGDNRVSLLGLETNSLIETDCHVNSISNRESKTLPFLSCITSTPTRSGTKTNEGISQLDLSSILYDQEISDCSEFLYERQISRIQFTNEFINSMDEEFVFSYTVEETEDKQIKDED